MNYKYTIRDNDLFVRDHYPQVVQEVGVLHLTIAKITSQNRNDIVISFLRDHAIRTEYLQENREIAEMMTSRLVSTSHIESLFDACRNNRTFCDAFERFIRLQLG